ncbi:AraC family transcriptional regulator [Nocardiopsis composta]|uniref:AraC-like DNA-binding protein n=1 Tax=Nocardiopsis composta TaxID=157465 RepID=A0A7W8QHK2_9ACTN|nr:helix-turn-helix transcriptional regulator [Nocardiopsis composta]MBB5430597.1 AraC-like DNA-binding protein [Nocardiopsis composta]
MPVTRQSATTARDLVDGGRIDRHRHDDAQAVFPGSGVLAVTTDAGSWVLPGGTSAIVVPAGMAHSHRAHGRTRLQTVMLPREVCAGLGLDTGAPRVVPVTPLAREAINAATLEGPPDPRRGALLTELLAVELARPGAGGTPAALLLPRPRDPRLSAVVDALLADPVRGSLADLARRTGGSERTLSRLCREDTGLSFPELRTRIRLLAALVHLADGGTVTAAAHRCGWSKPHSFIDAFRRVLGTTPGRYRAGLHGPAAQSGGATGPAE